MRFAINVLQARTLSIGDRPECTQALTDIPDCFNRWQISAPPIVQRLPWPTTSVLSFEEIKRISCLTTLMEVCQRTRHREAPYTSLWWPCHFNSQRLRPGLSVGEIPKKTTNHFRLPLHCGSRVLQNRVCIVEQGTYVAKLLWGPSGSRLSYILIQSIFWPHFGFSTHIAPL